MNVTEIGLWPLQVSVVLGFTALAQAVFLAVWMAGAGQPVGAAVNILLYLASVAMGLQTAAVRAVTPRVLPECARWIDEHSGLAFEAKLSAVRHQP